jgi:hypothetical protein
MKNKPKHLPRTLLLGIGILLFSIFNADAVQVSHPTMDQRLGYPAIIAPGGVFPSLSVTSPTAGTLEVELVNTETNAVLQTHAPRALTANTPASVTFTGSLPADGVFRVDLRILESQTVVFRDAYFFSVINTAALPANYSKVAHPDANGRMRYVPDTRGNRLPDYSGVGYLGGKDLPQVPTVLTLQPAPGDATQRIQDAIDVVSARTPDANGFRGALELAAGLYEIAGVLKIQQSGVVLRGVGPGNRQAFTLNPSQNLSLEDWKATMASTTSTVLVATGTSHRTILTIGGASGISLQTATSTEILNEYVPVGQRWFHVANPEYYSVGDTIQLERRGNADWISYIKMDQIPDDGGIVQWSSFDLPFEYTIKAIQGNRITIDSGLVCAIEKRWGGGRIRRFTEGGRISHSGVENLRAVSFWRINANGKDDTAHPDRFVSFANMRDGWARNVAAEHFTVNTIGMFFAAKGTLAITIQDCSALAGASSFYSGTGYDGSGRYWQATDPDTYVGRYGFLLSGQNGLVRGCYTINSRHAFALSSRVPGPNVFFNCTGTQSLTYSEPHHRWAVGGLYDNCSDKEFSLMNRLNYGTGHGWAGANFVAWNTKGILICEQPPTAQNWAIGHKSTRFNGPFHSWNLANYGVSYGYWESQGTHVVPQSLYTQQIADRESETQDYLILHDGSSETTAVLPQVTLSLNVAAEIGPD